MRKQGSKLTVGKLVLYAVLLMLAVDVLTVMIAFAGRYIIAGGLAVLILLVILKASGYLEEEIPSEPSRNPPPKVTYPENPVNGAQCVSPGGQRYIYIDDVWVEVTAPGKE